MPISHPLSQSPQAAFQLLEELMLRDEAAWLEGVQALRALHALDPFRIRWRNTPITHLRQPGCACCAAPCCALQHRAWGGHRCKPRTQDPCPAGPLPILPLSH